ncbi:hypothetical protein [Salisediminibacterium beveridgei]|uniref:Uncharacterized protein n=1 Tax=Salisediminibacterium beveridgei TaxID=632773 RepID=A0A1D7R000_9BACI|nr:hypothetical protein [Salisediminibacterium beveridgei]AOM84578.1 hypothetical protein BBEV_3263 [Salisediminibacterium beveridgei]
MSERLTEKQLEKDRQAMEEATPSEKAKQKSLHAMKREIGKAQPGYALVEKKKKRHQTLTGFSATIAAAAIGGLVLISSDDMAGWFAPAGTLDDTENEEEDQEAPEPVEENDSEAEQENEEENEESEEERSESVSYRFPDTAEWNVTADTFNDRAQRFYAIDMQAVDADERTDVIEEQPMMLLHEEGMPYFIYIPAEWNSHRTDEGSYVRYEMADDEGNIFHLLQFDTEDEEAARSELERQLDGHDAEPVDRDEQWVQDYHWTMDMGDEPVEQYRAEDGNRVHNWSYVAPEGYPDTPVILHSVETVEDDDQIELAGYFHSSFQRVYPTIIDESNEAGMNDRAHEAEFLAMSDHGPGSREMALVEVPDLGFSFYARDGFSDRQEGERGQQMIRYENADDPEFIEIGRFDNVDEALAYQEDWKDKESELTDVAEEDPDPRSYLGDRFGGEWLVHEDMLNLSMEKREELEIEGGLSDMATQETFFVMEHDGYGYYMLTGGNLYFSEFIDLILHSWQWDDGQMLIEE